MNFLIAPSRCSFFLLFGFGLATPRGSNARRSATTDRIKDVHRSKRSRGPKMWRAGNLNEAAYKRLAAGLQAGGPRDPTERPGGGCGSSGVCVLVEVVSVVVFVVVNVVDIAVVFVVGVFGVFIFVVVLCRELYVFHLFHIPCQDGEKHD